MPLGVRPDELHALARGEIGMVCVRHPCAHAVQRSVDTIASAKRGGAGAVVRRAAIRTGGWRGDANPVTASR